MSYLSTPEDVSCGRNEAPLQKHLLSMRVTNDWSEETNLALISPKEVAIRKSFKSYKNDKNDKSHGCDVVQ